MLGHIYYRLINLFYPQVLTVMPRIVIINLCANRLLYAQTTELGSGSTKQFPFIDAGASKEYYWTRFDMDATERMIAIRLDGGGCETVWSCGFPIHEVETYFIKLKKPVGEVCCFSLTSSYLKLTKII